MSNENWLQHCGDISGKVETLSSVVKCQKRVMQSAVSRQKRTSAELGHAQEVLQKISVIIDTIPDRVPNVIKEIMRGTI